MTIVIASVIACLIGQTHDSSLCDSDGSYLPILVVLKHTGIVLTLTLNVRLRAKSIINVN